MITWSLSTGANIVAQFEKNAQQPKAKQRDQKYRAKAIGVDYRGDQKWNEFTLVELIPSKSNHVFTTAKVILGGGIPQVKELRIHHNTRYQTPASISAPAR